MRGMRNTPFIQTATTSNAKLNIAKLVAGAIEMPIVHVTVENWSIVRWLVSI